MEGCVLYPGSLSTMIIVVSVRAVVLRESSEVCGIAGIGSCSRLQML